MRPLLLASLLTLPLAACGTSVGPSGATCPSSSTLTYDNFGKSFMDKYCLRCHSASVTGSARGDTPVGLDFDTVAAIRADISGIDKEAAGGATQINTDMPDGSPTPSDAERKQLGEWLACGAK